MRAWRYADGFVVEAGPSNTPVVNTLACREIARAGWHHSAEVVSPDPIGDPAAGRALVETLERLQSDLRAEGDRLDLADQRLNASSYFAAAKHVAHARALLAAALASG